ncbi:hypothetical protein ABVT39_020136 [Epinephelus coioides]
MEEQQSKLPQTREEYAQHLISQVKSELRKSPFVSNVFFGFTLMCVEEFTEREFACPCDTGWNSLFAAVYLVVPAVLVLLLMISIKCFQNRMDLKEHVESCASIFGPAIFWIIIVLWDGQTLACALTTWSGSYEDLDDAAPQKWCEPANLTSSQQSEYKAKTQRWFFMSQDVFVPECEKKFVTVAFLQGLKLILIKLTIAELQVMASTASREGRPALISHVRSEFKKSALVSNVFFGAILLCLEKFSEKEFACPCKVGSNAMFATAYLIVPAIVVFLLMMNIKDFKCGMSQKKIWETVTSSFVPAMFWIIIVLWDGHCVACMKTTWSGSYVEIDKAAPQKWCKPANLTSSQELDYKNETQHCFFVSQCVGMGLIVLIIAVYLIFKCCCQQEAAEVIIHQVNDNRDAADYDRL